MQNGKEIIISVGRSRKETDWEPQTIRWSEFIQRLSMPVESTETLEEYKALTKAQQDDLKDVGGYVGGVLEGRRRKGGSVKSRRLITLDLDNIPPGRTDDILKRVGGLGCAYAVSSTRKHEGAAPRLRVIVPVDRNLTADEYEPAARKMAQMIGIGFCDPSTFQPERFMYWPSKCRGAEYVFAYSDAGFVQADWLLNQYQDWRRVQEWPVALGEAQRLNRSHKRQRNPREKKGIIGAFCRVYDVPGAMEAFLPGVYEPCGENRYTYTGGSTTGGAVLYDNGDFLFSHHATDPAGQRLCNAFDLVRIHKFGHLDDEAKPDTPGHKLLSNAEMLKFAAALEDVRLEHARAMFSKDSQQENDEWLKRLEMDGNRLLRSARNVMLVLENDPRLTGKFQYDRFSEKITVMGETPWNAETKKRELTDPDMAGLRVFLETEYSLTGKEKIQDAFDTFIHKNATHAVRDYLDGLQWDGVERLDRVLIDYLGAEDTPYVRKVTRKLFCAGVARIYDPGVKYDYLVVLIGAQGAGKSTLARIMGKDWFTDSLKVVDMRDKTATEKLLGVWVAELAEMDGFSKVDSTTVKSFLSTATDRFRPAYGRFTVNRPRQSILIGTSNTKNFLVDETGNRRFLPVDIGVSKPTKSVFTDLEPVMDQIWAEAVARWRMGESLYPDKEMEEEARRQQEAHMQEDPREGMIAEFLKKPIPANWYSLGLQDRRLYFMGADSYQGEPMERRRICAAEVWVECFGYQLSTMTKREARQINAILTHQLKDWEWGNIRFGACYGSQRGLVKVQHP